MKPKMPTNRKKVKEEISMVTYAFSFINEWSQLTWKGYNWITFHFITLEIENDMKMTGGWDMNFIILGLGFYFRVNLDFEDSEVGERLKTLKIPKTKKKK